MQASASHEAAVLALTEVVTLIGVGFASSSSGGCGSRCGGDERSGGYDRSRGCTGKLKKNQFQSL